MEQCCCGEHGNGMWNIYVLQKWDKQSGGERRGKILVNVESFFIEQKCIFLKCNVKDGVFCNVNFQNEKLWASK